MDELKSRACQSCSSRLFGGVTYCPFCGEKVWGKASPPSCDLEPATESTTANNPQMHFGDGSGPIDDKSGLTGPVKETYSPRVHRSSNPPTVEWPLSDGTDTKPGQIIPETGPAKTKTPTKDYAASSGGSDIQPSKRRSPNAKKSVICAVIVLCLFSLGYHFLSGKTRPNGKGELSISTTPSGASLMIDGEKKGATPLAINNVGAGAHTLTVSKAGYETLQKRIEVAAGEKRTFSFALRQASPQQQTATLSVHTLPPGASLTIDGIRHGTTPCHAQKLSPGRHTISAVMAGYESENETVRLEGGDRKTITINLKVKTRTATQTPSPKSDDLSKAIEAFDKSRYDVTISLCTHYLQKYPNNSLAKYYLQQAREAQEKAPTAPLSPRK